MKTYIVLGVPHSATSFISKSLEETGVQMNNDLRKYYEDSSFVELNTRILSKAGGSVSYPPKEEKILGLDFDEDIKRILEKDLGGWKDPRTSLTVKKYFPHLDGDVYLICCFRKPQKIIESFEKDNKSIKRKTIDLINKSIISAIKEFCE